MLFGLQRTVQPSPGVMHSTVCHRLAQLRPAPHLAFTSNKAFIRYEKFNDNLGLNTEYDVFSFLNHSTFT